jgi:FMN-dependent NADH-azoreductase
MATILHIDSSPRAFSEVGANHSRSHSRQLAKKFITAWQTLHPEDTLTYRDLQQSPIPHITEEWIAADFTPPEARTREMKDAIAFSDELVDEFLAAERCVFSVPMHNFSVPSNFKAYIDQIVRVGRTFTVVQDGEWKGLVEGKKVLFITTRGADYRPNSLYAGWDCQEPFLHTAFKFIGVTDVQFVHASGLDCGHEARQRGLSEAQSEIQKLVTHW